MNKANNKKHVHCKECGKREELHWIEELNKKLIKNKLCFSCNFWLELYEIKDNKKVARINGHHYMIEPETDRGFRGYGGSKFIIKFFDGREITTKNLWHQGDIPERFLSRLSDNAEFIK